MYCIDNMTDKLNHTPQPELSEHDAELLSAYIDEVLSTDEKNELEARLLKDAFLQVELSAMRQMVAWMNALPTLKAPRDFTISAEDVAPIKDVSERKIIPMQNRNLWFVASAAAIVIVLVGFGAVFSSSSGSANMEASAPESVAFSATQIAPQEGEAAPEAFDMADNDADTALFESDDEASYDFAEESAQSAVGLSVPANNQAQAPPPADIARSADNTEQAFVLATQLPELSTIAQGGGTSMANTTQPLALIVESETNAGGSSVSETLADTGADAQDENEATDDLIAPDTIESDGTIENEESDDTISTEIESRSTEEKSSNLIQIVLNAVRNYVESQR